MSFVPDAYEFPKMQNNSMDASCRTQRSIDRSEDVFFVENLVRVISVAVNVAVV